MKVKKFSKRAFAVLLTVLLVLSAVPLCAGAVEDTLDFEYNILDDGTAEITGYNGSASTLVIPSEIDGYRVTSIGRSAFSDCTSLTSVTIPKSVTSIGDYTFYGCTSLENISVASNNDSYSSENGVLFNKEKTELIQYPAGKALTDYLIPQSVTSIDDYAFNSCTSLENINVTSNNDSYSSEIGVLFNKEKTKLIKYPAGKALTEYLIPDSVTSIDSRAFEYCTSLTNVKIPNSVTSIGKAAFRGCKNLTSVTIPDSITGIGDFTFSECVSLISVTIPDSVTGFGWYAFKGCESLIKITIPQSVTSIGIGAFWDCASLKSVIIFNGVRWIDGGAFNGCTSLECVTIPKSVTSITEYAFGYNNIEDTHSKIENFTICGYAGTEAERYSTDNGFTFIALDNESNIHSDSNTDISVIAKADADLTVSEITDEQGISNANTLLGGTETVKNLYNISLTKDGEKVQHEGMAEVKIPCDNENAKVYRVESDNTLTDMNAVYTDGNLVFHTEHFSLYIVAEEKKETETVGDMNNDGKLDVNDVTAIQIELAKAGTDYYDTVADTDKDGKVDVADVTFLQQFIASTVTVL